MLTPTRIRIYSPIKPVPRYRFERTVPRYPAAIDLLGGVDGTEQAWKPFASMLVLGVKAALKFALSATVDSVIARRNALPWQDERLKERQEGDISAL